MPILSIVPPIQSSCPALQMLKFRSKFIAVLIWVAFSTGSSVISEEISRCGCGRPDCQGLDRDPGYPEKPLIDRPGDRSRADNPPKRYEMDDCRRSGAPFCVHRFAKCSVDDSYSAWFAGGGAALFRGRPRESTEGTWGLDYDGLFGHANVWLKYTRGRNQGGEGAYRTDGEPKVVSRAHEILGFAHE